MTRRQHERRGYTIIELMMAITVMAIGVSGIIAMQKVTVASNRHAKNLAMATHLAQLWQDRLAADAASWNHPSSRNPGVRDIGTDTTWLLNVVGQPNVWVRPAWNNTLGMGPAFTALGDDTNASAQAHFCTHVRLSWLYGDSQSNAPVEGNGLLRAEVRVFWLREGGPGVHSSSPNGVCDVNQDPAAVGDAIERYHFVYMTTSIKQSTAS